MSEITWGREILVDGKRPAWLADGITYMEKCPGWHKVRSSHWPYVTAIRLPADHFAYQALDKGFEPWGGGDEAPADWDGECVLTDDKYQPVRFGDRWDWRADPVTAYGCKLVRIIGYRKRATPSADTVTVKRLTLDDVEAAYCAWSETDQPDGLEVFLARHWGLLREETLAERYTRETGKEATPEVIAAIEWAEVRHG